MFTPLEVTRLWPLHCGPTHVSLQAEKLRSKAQRPEQSRSSQQYARYLYYLGRIRAIQLEYTDAKDCLQQAARKVGRACPSQARISDKGWGPFRMSVS